jgi:hypothetical protein
MVMTLAEISLAAWLAPGALFAVYGFVTEDLSGIRPFGRVVLFIGVLLGWPLCFLPDWQKD